MAVRKGGAIAHPDNFPIAIGREVEQRSDSYRNENPCVPVPIAIRTIPGAKRRKDHKCVKKPILHYFCYIIYSKILDRYYIGYTSDIDERLKLHNSGHFGGKSFTHKSHDWEEYLLILCESIEQAIFAELRIKKMKSRNYIENLKKYPALIEKVIKCYGK